MPDIILHHYPQSPVSEKVRVVLGIKGLAWRSVEIPRIPPKPDLMPLTGGYRRTPVMQIGADVYCDSIGIIRELERRHPEPTLFPGGGAGMPWGVSRWIDGPFFNAAVKVVLGAAEALPEAFANDRTRLYFGLDADLGAIARDLPHVVAQLRGQFAWVEERLAQGREFLLGPAPGLPDALAYYLVWFLRGRWADGPPFLARYPAIEAWEQRVRAIGHGAPREMTATEALEIARAAEPATVERADPHDPQGLSPGMAVTVVPDEDGGDPVVDGTVRAVDAQTIAITRADPRVGAVCVHFPRVGYRVTRA